MGTLYLVGMGLCDENDMTRRAISLAASCGEVFMEEYTSRLVCIDPMAISKALGRPITVLDHEKVKDGSVILDAASDDEVALLCGGDPGFATTYAELIISAKEKGIEVRWIHAPSILPATAAITGLSPYKFGCIVTLEKPHADSIPMEPFEHMDKNNKLGLHTLILLEPYLECGEPQHLLIPQALDLLIKAQEQAGLSLINENTLMCGVARAGSIDPIAACGTMAELKEVDWGPPMHTLILPGALSKIETRGLVVLAGAQESSFE